MRSESTMDVDLESPPATGRVRMVWLRSAIFATSFIAFFFVVVPRWILAATGRPPTATGRPRVIEEILKELT